MTVRLAFPTGAPVAVLDVADTTPVYDPEGSAAPIPGMPRDAGRNPWFTFYTLAGGVLTPWNTSGHPALFNLYEARNPDGSTYVTGTPIPVHTPAVTVTAADGTTDPGTGNPVVRWAHVTGDGASYLLPSGATVAASAPSYALPAGTVSVYPAATAHDGTMWWALTDAHGQVTTIPAPSPAPLSSRAIGSGPCAVQVNGAWQVVNP